MSDEAETLTLPVLTQPELTFIQQAFADKNLISGLNRLGNLEYPPTEFNRKTWEILALRIRKRASKALVLAWRKYLAHRLTSEWYSGYRDSAIAEDLMVHVAQIQRWEELGIPIDPLLLALFLTGRWKSPLPFPGPTRIERLFFPVAIRDMCGYFHQAGVSATPCPPLIPPGRFELLRQILDSLTAWRATEKEIRASAGDRTAAFATLASQSVQAAMAAFTADQMPATELAPLRTLLGDPRMATRECLILYCDHVSVTAYGWANTRSGRSTVLFWIIRGRVRIRSDGSRNFGLAKLTKGTLMENENVSAENMEAFLAGKIDRLEPDSAFPALSPEIASSIVARSRAIDWFSVLHWGRIPINKNAILENDTLSAQRHPGRDILQSRDPVAVSNLTTLIRWEVEDILSFLPAITPAGVVKWVVRKLFGPHAMSDEDRKTFFPIIAEVNRDTFEDRAGKAATLDHLVGGRSTLGELAGQSSLDTLVSQPSAAGAAVAKGSRALDAIDPHLGKTLRLAYYAGLAPDEIAPLVGDTVAMVKLNLINADSFVRGLPASI